MRIIKGTAAVFFLSGLLALAITLLLTGCPTTTLAGNAAAGKYAYVACGDETLWIYSINQTGNLIYKNKIDVTGTGPAAIAVHPTSKYIYMANSANRSVSQYKVESDGNITTLDPLLVSVGTYPSAITIHPSGNYLYVVNEMDRNISQFNIRTDGKLTALTPPIVQFTVSGAATAISIDPTGRFAYVSIGNGAVVQMNISGDGKLSLMTNPTVSAGNGPNDLCISPDGRYVYVVNSSDDNISQFTIGDNGELELITSPVTTGDLPASVVIDPSGTYVYSVNAGDATISRFSIENNPLPGALNALPPSTVIGATAFPTQITIDPSGKYIYIVNNTAAGGVWQYNINSSDGSLTAMTPVSVSSGLYSQYIAILEK